MGRFQANETTKIASRELTKLTFFYFGHNPDREIIRYYVPVLSKNKIPFFFEKISSKYQNGRNKFG
jgi:hypothetical protein